MRIALDARPLCRGAGGISHFLQGILGALSAMDRENRYFLYAHRPLVCNAVPEFSCEIRAGKGGLGTVWLQSVVPFWLRRDGIDLFWGTQNVLPLVSSRSVRMLMTLHDMVYRRVPETMQTANLWINRCFVGPSLHKADRIVADSGWTAQDAVDLVGIDPGRIAVVYPGVDKSYRPIGRHEARIAVRELTGSDKPYVLTVGTFEPRKNLVASLAAFARLAHVFPHHLYIAGAPGWKMDKLLKGTSLLPPAGRVKWLGCVPQKTLPALYGGADAFLFPSLYEGFGLPPLEAMACGTPVVASNASCLPEILGEAALLIDPHDIEGLAVALGRVLSDENLRLRLREDGIRRAARFQWSESARHMLKLFSETA
jgi:glycosyltransferase involved in cell wall biosynthesis